MGTGGYFAEGYARPGRDTDHTLSRAEVKNEQDLCLLSSKRLHAVYGTVLF
jgi:hypothetical protein